MSKKERMSLVFKEVSRNEKMLRRLMLFMWCFPLSLICQIILSTLVKQSIIIIYRIAHTLCECWVSRSYI